MARKRRTVTWNQLAALDNAVKYAQMAQESARLGGAPNAARYIAKARKSLKGAQNHARGVWQQYLAQLEPDRVRQTCCRLCDLDIEGFAPYPAGEWRDRGNNTHCPDGRQHEAVP